MMKALALLFLTRIGDFIQSLIFYALIFYLLTLCEGVAPIYMAIVAGQTAFSAEKSCNIIYLFCYANMNLDINIVSM